MAMGEVSKMMQLLPLEFSLGILLGLTLVLRQKAERDGAVTRKLEQLQELIKRREHRRSVKLDS
jgi:hypothetical protein